MPPTQGYGAASRAPPVELRADPCISENFEGKTTLPFAPTDYMQSSFCQTVFHVTFGRARPMGAMPNVEPPMITVDIQRLHGPAFALREVVSD